MRKFDLTNRHLSFSKDLEEDSSTSVEVIDPHKIGEGRASTAFLTSIKVRHKTFQCVLKEFKLPEFTAKAAHQGYLTLKPYSQKVLPFHRFCDLHYSISTYIPGLFNPNNPSQAQNEVCAQKIRKIPNLEPFTHNFFSEVIQISKNGISLPEDLYNFTFDPQRGLDFHLSDFDFVPPKEVYTDPLKHHHLIQANLDGAYNALGLLIYLISSSSPIAQVEEIYQSYSQEPEITRLALKKHITKRTKPFGI